MGWKKAEGGIAAAVGTDLWAGNRDQVTPYPRKILAGAYIGGNAVGESVIDIYVGAVYVTTLQVTTAAAGLNKNVDVLPMDIMIPANTMLHGYITTVGSVAVTTNWFLFG